MKPSYTQLSTKQNQTKLFVLEKLASFPANAILGRIIYHTGFNKQYTCINGIENSADTTLAINWSTGVTQESVAFSYVNTSISIKNLIAGQRLLVIQMIIDTPFNGSSPIATVGISGNVNKFMKSYENDLTEISKFEVNPNYLVSTGEELVTLYLTPNGSTQGNGIILIQYL